MHTKRCVTEYIFFFKKLDKRERSMILIEKLKVLNDGLNKKNKTPFMLPYVASQNAWTKKFLKHVSICKELLEPCLKLVVNL